MNLPAAALENAVLIVAHPDDEILWFGSVVERMARIVIVFEDHPDETALGDARRSALAQHPLASRIESLGMTETGTFDVMDWEQPTIGPRGPELGDRPGSAALREIWQPLSDTLDTLLDGYRNVFTHNPWGDYGNEEHILVHHAVNAAALRHGVRCWYSNYVSNRSQALMTRYVTNFETPAYSEPVDTARMQQVAGCYQQAGCWTWLPGYRWFDREYFVQGPLEAREKPAAGSLFPLNFVRLRRAPGGRRSRKTGLLERLRRRTGKRS